MSKGEGCLHLHLLQISDRHGVPSKRAHRCCYERHGFMLKHWRCVGKDSPDCPGFASRVTKDTLPHEEECSQYTRKELK